MDGTPGWHTGVVTFCCLEFFFQHSLDAMLFSVSSNYQRWDMLVCTGKSLSEEK
jgi:hypothetical protein